jgi:hypothetical protein
LRPSPLRLICSPDHPGAEHLEQHLGIGRVVAQIGDDEGIVVMAAVDRGERNRSGTAIEPLRQFFEFDDAEAPLSDWTVAADDGGRAVAAASDIVSDDQRVEARPCARVIRIVSHGVLP